LSFWLFLSFLQVHLLDVVLVVPTPADVAAAAAVHAPVVAAVPAVLAVPLALPVLLLQEADPVPTDAPLLVPPQPEDNLPDLPDNQFATQDKLDNQCATRDNR
jgi:hypothetical protein